MSAGGSKGLPDTEVWINTGSREDLPVDMPALLETLIHSFDPSRIDFVNSGFVRLQDASGLTLNLRGVVTKAGFEVATIGVVAAGGQRLISLLYHGSLPQITDLSQDGYLDGEAQALTALKSGDGLRMIVGGGVGSDVLTGGIGNDTLGGGNGTDTLIGGQGNDLIRGGWGRDLLAGWAGDDTLAGGGGMDFLTGGRGADVFQFDWGFEANLDRISDFSRAEGDRIDLSMIDPGGFASGDSAFVLSSNDTFHGKVGELRLLERAAGTFVQGDMDGDGLSDFSLLVRGVFGLGAEDFVF